ncbi:MAG: cytidine deaminase [Candidatus Eisenbacteria sp.]|nr:cytidine deaminase [Candidatus Eisenbacteria bacterium]
MTDEELMQMAMEARESAHAPYSSFKVGAALETLEGEIFRAANVENASYGLSCCAERNAMFAAVSAGKRGFRRMAVVSSDSGISLRPCGACLQVLWEFAPDMDLLLQGPGGRIERRKVRDLLPEGFTFDYAGENTT